MISLAESAPTPVPDDYLELVRAFPLRALRTKAEHTRGLQVLGRLLGRPDGRLSAGERDYVQVLGRLLDDFADGGHPRPRPKVRPLEMLRFLMDQHGMNVVGLGKILGNKTAASLVLSGKRELSKAHIRSLAAHFKVNAGLFI
ncbi:MAG: transcriptional regulator [Tepidisphaeraceae bacterium]|jgi:HTH-type transcriptional regulator/antitoxin HigA